MAKQPYTNIKFWDIPKNDMLTVQFRQPDTLKGHDSKK